MIRGRAGPIGLRADVVVVGARCAGAATTRLLAQDGLDVVMVDRAEFPGDTLTAHAIGCGGMVQLLRWGLLDRLVSPGVPPICEVSLHAGGEPIVRRIKDRHGVDFLLPQAEHHHSDRYLRWIAERVPALKDERQVAALAGGAVEVLWLFHDLQGNSGAMTSLIEQATARVDDEPEPDGDDEPCGTTSVTRRPCCSQHRTTSTNRLTACRSTIRRSGARSRRPSCAARSRHAGQLEDDTQDVGDHRVDFSIASVQCRAIWAFRSANSAA